MSMSRMPPTTAAGLDLATIATLSSPVTVPACIVTSPAATARGGDAKSARFAALSPSSSSDAARAAATAAIARDGKPAAGASAARSTRRRLEAEAALLLALADFRLEHRERGVA